jgi:hypothetical protein
LFEPQPATTPACFVELHLDDGFPWYEDDSVLHRKDDAVQAYFFQHAARHGGTELTVPAAAAKHFHRDLLSYPDAWYFAGGIAEFLLKRLLLFCSLLPEFVSVSHGSPPRSLVGILPLTEAFASVLGIKPGATRPLESILTPLTRAYLAYSPSAARSAHPGRPLPYLRSAARAR